MAAVTSCENTLLILLPLFLPSPFFFFITMYLTRDSLLALAKSISYFMDGRTDGQYFFGNAKILFLSFMGDDDFLKIIQVL